MFFGTWSLSSDWNQSRPVSGILSKSWSLVILLSCPVGKSSVFSFWPSGAKEQPGFAIALVNLENKRPQERSASTWGGHNTVSVIT